MRTPIIAGNWKLNKNQAEARELAAGVVEAVKAFANVDVAVCPTFTSLQATGEAIQGSNVALGAQNVNENASGAYTGEISPGMLKELGCAYCIVGHSERRQYYNETDAGVNAKAKALFEQDMTPIICVGETLDERKADKTLAVVLGQVRGCFDGLTAEQASRAVIAYEPVWAIGTGEVATPEQAQDVHAAIRAEVAKLYDADTAAATRIQYGGSMKPGNAAELLAQADIDGGLIGGASLKPADFAGIIEAASK